MDRSWMRLAHMSGSPGMSASPRMSHPDRVRERRVGEGGAVVAVRNAVTPDEGTQGAGVLKNRIQTAALPGTTQ